MSYTNPDPFYMLRQLMIVNVIGTVITVLLTAYSAVVAHQVEQIIHSLGG